MKISKLVVQSFKMSTLGLFLLLFIIHFVLKDRWHWISVLFYAAPLPVLIVFGLLVSVMLFKRKVIFYPLILLLGGMCFIYFKNYYGKPLEISSSKLSKVVLWNVSQNNTLPTEIIIQNIENTNAEIIALVEAEYVTPKDLDVLHKACPDYSFRKLYGYMLIGIKGEIKTVELHDEAKNYKFNYITATIDQSTQHIMLVDIYAAPFLNKEVPLNIIADFSSSHPTDIILGDFNTPFESVHFEKYKHRFNSFHDYSDGATATWPVPLPVLEIDLIWISKKFRPVSLQKISYPISDHKLLIATYK